MAIAAVVGVAVLIGVTSGNGAPPRGVTVADATGFTYTSKAGHFSAHFPDRPDERHDSRTLSSGVIVNVYVASSTLSNLQVESHRYSEDEYYLTDDDFLDDSINGGPDDLITDNQTTFQGHPAREGTYKDDDGTGYSVMITAFSDHQIYYLIAPSGQPYNDLKSTFTPT